MNAVYSIHDAEAQFSEILRQVRDGATITITCQGEPVAEISPLQVKEPQTLEEQLDDLERRGILVRSHVKEGPSQLSKFVGEPCPGALERFLKDRNRF